MSYYDTGITAALDIAAGTNGGPPLVMAEKQLAEQCDRLDSVIAGLYERLAPVLRPEPQAPASPAGDPKVADVDQRSDHLRILHELTSRFAVRTRRIEQLLDRLEV